MEYPLSRRQPRLFINQALDDFRRPPFTDEQLQQAANVCLIGKTVRDKLFPQADAVGHIIRIQGQPYEVVGVLGAKGQSATGQDRDDTVFLPYTTAQKKLRGKGFNWLDDILCSAVSLEAVNPANDQVVALMRQRHHIRPGEEDDFNIRRPDELIKAEIEANRTFELFLISVASIALLVGGIGIMNVMLVSVTQRTREIGLRLAVGATAGNVRAQFLGEAVLLSILGGVVGLLLGTGGCWVIARILEWNVDVPLDTLWLGPGFSASVGVLSGLYPAERAARMDPIEALRHE